MTIAASPERPAREAALALQFGSASIKRPERGMPVAVLRQLPEMALPKKGALAASSPATR